MAAELSPPRLKLHGPQPQIFEIGARLVLGRHPAADAQLRHPTVARRHAALVYVEGVLYLEDYGSANGCFVNGARVDRRCVVGVGDQIHVGGVHLEIIEGQ